MSSGMATRAACVMLAVGAGTSIGSGLAYAARAQTVPVRILQIRVGGHSEFDRLVIEVEGELRAYHQPVRSGEQFVIELNARPAKPIEVLDTPYERMGRVRIEGIADGALIAVQARPRNVRAFVLSEPTRVVIDFSSPDKDPLPIPEGAAKLLEAIAPPWVEVEPETPEPIAENEVAPLADPQPEPEPQVAGPDPDPPEPAAVPEPAALPEPAAAGRAPADRTLALALGAVTLVAVLAVAVAFVLRFRRPPPPGPEVASRGVPDTITPAELVQHDATADRLGALESRLDEEVRSRTRVEDKLSQLHEDIKVVRDRLHRVSRRGSDD